MIFAYVRVSTADQNPDSQIDELKKHGFDELFIDKISGSKSERPALNQLLNKIRKGDTVIIYRLDRLGRSLKHLIELVDLFHEKGVSLVSVSDSINTKSASGKLIFHIFGAIADFERGLIQERTKIGLSAARARGRLGGRPKGLTDEAKKKAKIVYQLYNQEEMTVREICDHLNIASRSTAYRYIDWGKENLGQKSHQLHNKPLKNSNEKQ